MVGADDELEVGEERQILGRAVVAADAGPARQGVPGRPGIGQADVDDRAQGRAVGDDGVLLEGRRFGEHGVDEVEVQRLEVVLRHQLPVAGDLVRQGPAPRDLVQVVFPDPGQEGRGVVLEGFGLAVDIDEEPVAPPRHAHGLQRQAGLVEPLGVGPVVPAPMGRRPQGAVEIVGPAVVAAAQSPPAARRAGHQERAAVRADVVEALHLARPGAGEEQGNAGHGPGRHVAGFGCLVGVARAGPCPGEEARPFLAREVLAGVGEGRQAPGLRRRPEQRLGLVRGQHGVILETNPRPRQPVPARRPRGPPAPAGGQVVDAGAAARLVCRRAAAGGSADRSGAGRSAAERRPRARWT